MKRKIFITISILLILLNFNIYTYSANTSTNNTNSGLTSLVEDETDEDELNIYSGAAVLMDSNTGLVLYSKNKDTKMYPASTTKILTAIIAIETCDLDDIVTVSSYTASVIPAGYSSAYLVEGEEISVEDLLLSLLIHSANDSGYALAEYISGSIDDFANLMNEKVLEIGCTNTHFTNPSGIHDDDHYTTAYDLGLIARYCMTNSTFREMVSTKSCTIASTNKSEERTYSNTNSLLDSSSKYYIEACIGGKTGFTTEAQNCLVSAYSKDNMELISIVLGAEQTDTNESARYVDSTTLYNYGYSNYSMKDLALKNDIIETITIANATKETKDLDLLLEGTVSCLVKNGDTIDEPSITINSTITAPIEESQVVGTITYKMYGNEYTENLLASHSVEENPLFYYIYIPIIIFFVIILILILIIKKSKKKKRNNYHYCKHF